VKVDFDYISTPRAAEIAGQERSEYREEVKERRGESPLIYFSALYLP
jgi:predicted HTH domain antitoxin